MRSFLLSHIVGLLAFAPSFSQIPEPIVYFKQDFCEAGLQFQSNSPNSGQVDHVIATSPATATTGTCYFDAERTVASGGGSVRLVRTTPLAAQAPQTLHALIDLEVSNITSEETISGYFGIGNGLPSNSILIPNASLFSKLSIDFKEDGTYNFRVSSSGSPATLSNPLTGRVKITWTMNNSAENLTYFSPLKTPTVLPPDQFDIWINDEKWISGAGRISEVDLNNFAFILSNGVGKVRLHHLELSSNGFQLPLILTRFAAERRLNQAVINWTMAPGHTAASFVVERSRSANTFEAIGSVSVDNPELLRFQFVDPAPNVGFNYYRLKMIGVDAEVKYSPITQVDFDPDSPTITLASNPAAPDKISMLAAGVTPGNLSLKSMMGRDIAFSHAYDNHSMRLTLYPSTPLSPGIYLLHLKQERVLKSFKVIIP